MNRIDYDAILHTILHLYIDGYNEHDAKKLGSAFHKDAWIFLFDKEGNFRNWHIDDETFAMWAKDEGDDPIQPRIISVSQMGDIANVQLAFGDRWLDCHNLARIDGVWKITNKTATYSGLASPPWSPKGE